MRIALFGRRPISGKQAWLSSFIDSLACEEVEVVVFFPFLKRLPQRPKNIVGTFSSHDELIHADCDFLFSIGGDGTILDAVTFVREANIPIVGLNYGKLGFLANIPQDAIAAGIKSLTSGEFFVEERSLVQVEALNGQQYFNGLSFGLNEFAVQKKDTTMLQVKVEVDDKFLNTYWADGLIISTPTGSTAYSLSAGGPIVMPHARCFSLSPISPHNLTVRPMILPDDLEIKMSVSSTSGNYLVSLDHRSHVISEETVWSIKRADFTAKLIQFESDSFYKTLRNKLMWGVDKRN